LPSFHSSLLLSLSSSLSSQSFSRSFSILLNKKSVFTHNTSNLNSSNNNNNGLRLCNNDIKCISILASESESESESETEIELPQTIELKQVGSALYIHLNRADLHNAFNEIMIKELTAALNNCTKVIYSKRLVGLKPSSNTIRCVVITGNGPSFSAGADLNWMKKMKSYSEQDNQIDANRLFDMFLAIRSCPVPVIAKVNGHAFGGGVGIVAASDIALAHNDAKFGLTEVRLGIGPAVISKFVMDKIGRGACSRYFLTGERFSAEEAARIGLVTQIANTQTELDSLVDKLIAEISQTAPGAVSATKTLIDRVASCTSIEDSRHYVTTLIARLRVSSEGQLGIDAFLNKQQPPWQPAKPAKQNKDKQ